jgi:hypothetical protein
MVSGFILKILKITKNFFNFQRLKTAAAKKLSSSSNPATPTSPLSAFFVSSTVNYVVKIFNGEEWLPRDALTVENETTGERLQLEHHATGPCSRYHVLRRWATGGEGKSPIF